MSEKPALYLNMILGDFENPEVVQRSVESVLPHVDGAYLTITYKKKKPTKKHKLVEILSKYPNVHLSFFKWTFNFAEARNFALDQIPAGDRVFVYWQDADDVLQNGEKLPLIVEDMVAMDQSAVYFDYLYQVDLDGEGNIREVLVEHKRERIIRHNHTWKWVGGLHETLIEQKNENLIRIYRPDCRVVHLTDNFRLDDNLDRNIEILESEAKRQNREDPRTLVYLGKAYLDKGRIFVNDPAQQKIYLDLALSLFHEYLNGEGRPGDASYRQGSGFREERSGVWAHIAEIAILRQNPQVAIGALMEAISEAPEFPEYYADLSLAYASMGDFKKAKQWLITAVNTPEPKTTIVRYPKQLKRRALEASLAINLHEQKLDQALQDAKLLSDLDPSDPQSQEKLALVENLHAFNKACQSVVYLGKYLERVGEKDKVPFLIKSIPAEAQRERFASEMRHQYLPPKTWEDDEIAILCGPGVGTWSPKSVDTVGLGGSEEAVVYLSQELKKLGWKVTVYANPGPDAGDHDGVTYVDWYDLDHRDKFNVLISWRTIGFADLKPKAKFHMIWLHDVPNNADFTQERVDSVDKIAVLSEYHKSLLRMVDKDGNYVPVPDEKLFVTANGIPDLPQPTGERDPKKMVYISSPDRGLVYLLKHWSKIKEGAPEATLDIYYGFDTFDVLHQDNPAMQEWKRQVMAMMKQPGITYYGKVDHHRLSQALATAGVWAYPTHFEEISCISAMKSQAMGAVPVTTDYAALKETVRNGIRVDVNIRKDDGQEEYVKALVNVLNDTKLQEEMRPQMINWARKNLHWSVVANTWDSLFKTASKYPETKFQLPNKFELVDKAPTK